MAMAEMAKETPGLLEDSNRTAKGVNTDREGAMRGANKKKPPLDTDRVMRPGERIPNTQGLDIRGD